MVRWIKYEGEGTPSGTEGVDWMWLPDPPRPDVIGIKVEENIYGDNSQEAVSIMEQLGKKDFKLSNVKCKECGRLMEKYLLHPHPKANRLGWKFRYICSNNDCLYEYYTKEDV